MNDDTPSQEPAAAPDPAAGDGAGGPRHRLAETPRRDPFWTLLLTPIAVLIGAAAIGGAVWVTGEDPPPPESVAPALNDISAALAALSADVDALSDEVALLSVELELATAVSRAAAEPAAPASLRATLEAYAVSIGLDAEAFSACIADPATYDAIGDQLQRGVDLGVNGTPTFFVNNKLVSGAQPAALFEALIAMELAGSPASLDEYPEAIRELAERDPPGFAILPERPDPGGAAIEGNPRAPVVIVEFSDFQCPFCRHWYDETLPALRDQLGDDVSIAFLHFPLTSIHPNAAAAHAAAECAGDQGKFWEMHDLLFELQDEWSGLPDSG